MMADPMIRGFRDQLSTAMDLVLKTAVSEAMRIFENVLCGYQMQLAQKGEEVAQLKVKLRRTELKLKEHEDESSKEPEKNQTEEPNKKDGTEPQKEVVLDAPRHTSEVPEIDFEVPDEWCAPLGCETATVPEDGVCPSIRLRPFSIPLRQIPVSNQEEVKSDMSLQSTSGRRISKRISTLKNLKHTNDGKLLINGQEGQHRPMRNDVKLLLYGSQHSPVTSTVKILLRDFQEEYPGQSRKRRRNSTENKHDGEQKQDQEKSTSFDRNSSEAEKMENGHKNQYSCKHCKKVFETKVSRNMHEPFHNRCRGCQKRFRFRNALKAHKRSCTKLRRLLVKEGVISKTPCNARSPLKNQVSLKSKDACSSGNNAERSAIEFSSKYHGNGFDVSRLRRRMQIYAYEKPYPCSLCPKKYQTSQGLGIHCAKSHKNHMSTTDPSEDLGWTEPLEDIEDSEKDVTSPIKNLNQNGHT